MPVPNELRSFYGKPRIPTGALGRLRRAIEADDLFRQRIGAGALPDLVDDVGRLWLQRPSNWVADAEALIRRAASESEAADTASALKRSERRRVAAEEAAVRSVAESHAASAIADEHQAEVDRLRADLTKADELLAEVRLELIDVRNEARPLTRSRGIGQRPARGREQRTRCAGRCGRGCSRNQRRSRTCRPTPNSNSSATWPTCRRGRPPTPHSAWPKSSPDARASPPRSLRSDPMSERRRNGRTEPRAGDIGPTTSRARCRAASSPVRPRRPSFLARSGAAVLIDGYNVAMLGWPKLGARGTTVGADRCGGEPVSGVSGPTSTIVFDGAEVVGAHSGRRRTTRVMFSPTWCDRRRRDPQRDRAIARRSPRRGRHQRRRGRP